MKRSFNNQLHIALLIATVNVIRTLTDEKTETQQDFSPSPQSLVPSPLYIMMNKTLNNIYTLKKIPKIIRQWSL